MKDGAVLNEHAMDLRPEITWRELLTAVSLTALFVAITRLPFARPEPFEWDEIGFIQMIAEYRLPMHHTLFLAMARVLGIWLGDAYRGFIALDVGMSAVALVSVWWWLRALVRPATAAAATLLLAVSPTVWTYGAMAGNYTGIIAVGSFLLGIVVRTWQDPRAWHPYAAAVVLALGAGYRQDIGTFWTPILLLILWRHRWKSAILAGLLFVLVNLSWFVPMLIDVGGWARYRAASQAFAHNAGYMNSVFYLGFVDATARYVVKLGLAVCWTFGLALLAAPLGLWRLIRSDRGRLVPSVLLLSVLPPLTLHLTIHFGLPGYAFHYVPALIALIAMGVGGLRVQEETFRPRPVVRLAALSVLSAAMFLLYTPDYERTDARASFDLSIGRCTRVGLVTRPPDKLPSVWRTANSLSIKKTVPRFIDGRIIPSAPLNRGGL